MSPDPSAGAEERRADRASVVPTLAVLAVAIAAVAAAFMSTRPDTPEAQPTASVPPPPRAVVRAPPLVVTAPPLKPEKPVPARAMGSAPACDQCGVVESVVAAKPGDRFQMRIRMDDGSLRTVEQRGALAAGTRVVVEGGSVRLPG